MTDLHALGLDPRTTPARPDLAAAGLRGRVEAPRYAEGRPMVVAAPSAPLRRAPRADAGLDTEALRGEGVTLYEDGGEGWAWVQLDGDGYVGWLPSADLAAPGPAPTHRVAVPRTFVYPGPSMKLPPREALSLGARLAVTGTEGAFAALAGGGHAWAAHLAPLGQAAPDFAAVAEAFEHAPYLWGGRTSLGLDCSGLVQLALGAAGIAAPRDSDQQERALGEPVPATPDLAGLRRGDLVFWRGHVGMMLDGATLLHANGHHMQVRREPLAGAAARIAAGGGGAVTGVRRVGTAERGV